MTIHSRVANQVLTRGFYIVNAMFFLVVMLFCFGFMRGAEHIALAEYFVGSPWLVMIPIGLWCLYTLKITVFNVNEVRREPNRFLTVLPLLPFRERLATYAVVSLSQLAPAIAYGAFLVAIAWRHQQLVSIFLVAGSLAVLSMITIWSLHRVLVHPEHEITTAAPIRWLDRHFVKPVPWMFVEGIIRLRPGFTYSAKIISCLVIYGATHLYAYEDYDARLYSAAACIAFSANLTLVYLFQVFEVMLLSMTRTMAITHTTRIKWLLITMSILCLPEIAMLATNLPAVLGIHHYLFAIVFGLSLTVLFYGWLYTNYTDFEDYTRWIFFMSMGWIVLILFNLPLIAGAVVHTVVGMYLLKKHYYTFDIS